MNTLINNWENTLELLKPEVTPVSFDTWFSPLKPLKIDTNTNELYVVCDDSFISDIIQKRYLSLLENMIRLGFKHSYTLKFVKDETKIKNEEYPKPESISSTSTITEKFKNEYIFNPRYSFENFVVGSNNEYAHAVSLAVAENPANDHPKKLYNPLFLYGPSGLGKTHLMHAIGHYILQHNENVKVLYVSSEMFTNECITAILEKKTAEFKRKYREIDVLLIDDIQFIEGKDATQEEFFHTFNTLYETNKQIVISSDRPPKDLVNLDERLTSRFGWNIVADIKRPDFETRMAILQKLAEQENIPLNANTLAVLSSIAEKIKYNIRELEGAFTRVISFSRLLSKPITPAFATDILKDIINEDDIAINSDLIKRTVAKYFNITVKDLESKKRARSISHPRQIAMFLCRTLTDMSLPKIGNEFGQRDHTTVLHAYEKIDKLLKEDSNTQEIVAKLKEQIIN